MSQVNQHIRQMREDFMKSTLSESDATEQPSALFETWFRQALETKVTEVQACTLSTVSREGRPSGRILYLREFEADHYWFYTNYHSRKAANLVANPFAAMTFFWPELERQIRIEGRISLASAENSDAYFEARPRESQIGAWSSEQSHVLKDRQQLEEQLQHYRQQFEGKSIPRPPFWGGYVLEADYYEFWQGRKSRLHDRLCYKQQGGIWSLERLSP